MDVVRGRRLLLRRQPAAAAACPTLVDLFRREGSKVDRVAVVSDVRGGEYFAELSSSCSTSCTSAASSTRSCSSRRPTRRWCGASRRRAAATRWPARHASSTASARNATCWPPARARPPRHRHERHLRSTSSRRASTTSSSSTAAGTNLVFAFVSFGYKYGIPHRRRPAVRRALPAEPATTTCACGRSTGPGRPGARLRAPVGRLHSEFFERAGARCSTSSSRATRPRARRT